VHFETDSLNLQQASSSSVQDRGPLGVLFREVKFLLQFGFSECKILYCPRVCNFPAHMLAAVGSNAEPECQLVWHTDFLVDVTNAVTADLVGPE
jgi:hypothetical protein